MLMALLTWVAWDIKPKSPEGGARKIRKTKSVPPSRDGLLVDLIMYGVTNTPALKAVAADIAVYAVISAIAGAIVGWVLGSGKKIAVV
jgi:hypothetical protein